MEFCNDCNVAKLHQFNFTSLITKSTAPFDLIVSNLWRPSPDISVDGYRYYVHFVDGFTRFTWIFPLKTKSKVITCFIRFNSYVERQVATKIKAFQSDWGGEYRTPSKLLRHCFQKILSTHSSTKWQGRKKTFTHHRNGSHFVISSQNAL